MVDRPNTTPIGQDKKTLLCCFALFVQARPWFLSSKWISSVAGIPEIESLDVQANSYPHRGTRGWGGGGVVGTPPLGFRWVKIL